MSIAKLPKRQQGLTEHEKNALHELIPLAQERSMHDDPLAAEALSWMRAVLGQDF